MQKQMNILGAPSDRCKQPNKFRCIYAPFTQIHQQFLLLNLFFPMENLPQSSSLSSSDGSGDNQNGDENRAPASQTPTTVNTATPFFGSSIFGMFKRAKSGPPASSGRTDPNEIGNAASTTGGTTRPYDVFINHRGPDVKWTLASSLYHWLQSTELQVFFDTEEFRPGEELKPAITEAVRTASVNVAIFSKRYAESSWCLNELALMLETGAKIIPVFYDVKPSDLRWIDKGIYAEAFAQHVKKGRESPQTISKWRKALEKVSVLSGFELQTKFNGDQGKLMKTIVDTVLENVKRVPLEVATDPVGLDEAVEDFENFMAQSNQLFENEKVQMVGIVGLGGSGKSTLAKELYNRKRSSFAGSCFLFDVREASGNHALHTLQSKLLKDLANMDRKIDSVSEGKEILRKGLQRSRRVLIVLDDVDHPKQAETLIVKDALALGSLILITSRDEGVLRLLDASAIYRVKGLAPKHAQELFCRHAFRRSHPIGGFENLVQKSLDKCGGLPLFLKVIGGHLRLYGGDNKDDWERELRKISEIPDILRVSYDALGEEEKQIFLDIACFFVGEDKNSAVRFWDGSGWNGPRCLRTLEFKCLVEFEDEDRIKMHDHLRDLGREIANQQPPWRFWRPEQARKEVWGIMAATRNELSHGFASSSYRPPFGEVQELLGCSIGLKLLVIEGNNFDPRFANFSRDLTWLRWYGCPHKSIPPWLSMGNLRVLQLFHGIIEEWWQGAEQLPLELRELKVLSDGFSSFPKSIGLLNNLEKMVLQGWTGENLPEEFCDLHRLKHLELTFCHCLQILPSRFDKLADLKHLDLSHCTNLLTLPKSFGRLTQLKFLSLRHCWRLVVQPENFSEITTLEHLDFNQCRRLQVLPMQITCQGSLRVLNLGNTGLKELPNEFGRLINLKILVLRRLERLTSLPASLGNLTLLREIELERCKELRCLPESVGELKNLASLSISNSGIEYLPKGLGQLSNLQTLTVCKCPISALSLRNANTRTNLVLVSKPTLKNANLCGRELVLQQTPDFKRPGLPSILDSSISIQECMYGLKHLSVSQTKLSSISILDCDCPNLERLALSRNIYLIQVEALPAKLEFLTLQGCSKLTRILGISGLAKLQILDISACEELETLPNLAHLRSLKELYADSCWKLHSMAGLDRLQRLTRLQLSADNEAIWDSIQQLEKLPSNLSSMVLSRRAVLNSLIFQGGLTVVDLNAREDDDFHHWDLQIPLTEVNSWSAIIICFLSDQQASRVQFFPLGGAMFCDVSMKDGEWLYLCLFTRDSAMGEHLTKTHCTELSFTKDDPPEVKVKKGWMIILSEQDRGNMFEVLKKLLMA